MNILLVGLGGALGSMARFGIGRAIGKKAKTALPVGTFVINITGAFLLGIVMAYSFSARWYLLLAEGFLGAYTTFSTFMFEGFSLIENHEKLNALLYIVLSICIGIFGFWAGMRMVAG